MKPLMTTCNLCGNRYDMMKAKHLFIHPFCPAWPIYKHDEIVSLNMYDTEMDIEQEIELAWEAKGRSIIALERGSSEYKIRCWYCNEWFLSDSNMPAGCYKCATVKEEL